MSPASPVLETAGLTISFGGHKAVNDVSCAFASGTLTAIVGPNGAGKTTYFNLISGQLKATSGRVHLFGQDITRFSVSQRTRRGIGRAFQLTNLFPNLTVLENVRLAVEARRGHSLDMMTLWSRHKDIIAQAEMYVSEVGLAHQHNNHAAVLSHGDKRKLEVAIMLALEPDVFMFDEPTAGMSIDEVPVILNLIQKIKNMGGKTILLVEHKMDVVRSLADRIIVLHQGALVADGMSTDVIASPIVQEAYLGVTNNG